MTGDIPTKEQVGFLQGLFKERGKISKDLIDHLKSFPSNQHPMTLFASALLYLQKDSHFHQAYYGKKLKKSEYWEYIYNDIIDLVAKIPKIAAIIYRIKYRKGELVEESLDLDWAGNYARMLGFEFNSMMECLRGYLTIHSDHGGGNVSAHATTLVGSTLVDPYVAYASGLNGLAGPLHGLANQEVVTWILDFIQKVSASPTDQEITSYVDNQIKQGKVIPGYGHAVLRETDPRYTHLLCFALQNLRYDSLTKLQQQLAGVIVPHLKKNHPKIGNPAPNVDNSSGSCLYSLGMTE